MQSSEQRFTDGLLTKQAGVLFEEMRCDEDSDGIPNDVHQLINGFCDIHLFSEKVGARIMELDYAGNLDDTNSVVAFILQKCGAHGISGLSRQTLSNWLSKSAPTGNTRSRESVYKLCFALEMNVKQTAEFFLKGYLERPFNCKSLNEAVYYFCMNTNRSYATAEKLINKLSTMISEDERSGITRPRHTEDLRTELSSIEDENEFINYALDNRDQFGDFNYSATQKIKKLLDECKDLANQIRQSYRKDSENSKSEIVTSDSELLEVIYGRPGRTGKRDYLVWQSISDSDLPPLISRNMPQDQQISDILNGKGSYEAIRKVPLLLQFYEFFADAELSICYDDEADQSYDLFCEFTDTLDKCLADCGYAQHYWRNPYDWLIGYCAYQRGNPLDVLRDFMDVFAGAKDSSE